MNRVWIIATVLLLSLALAPAARAQTALHIATANPAKIFTDMQETKDLKEKLENDNKDLLNQEKTQQQAIQDLNTVLKQLTPGSQQYNAKRKELIQKAVELDTWKKVNQAQMQDQQKLQMKLLFDKITEATKAVAEAKKLDLVLAETNVDFPQDLDQINVDQLRNVINQRNILFKKDGMDISAEITAKLDADYKAHGSTSTAAPAVAPVASPAPAVSPAPAASPAVPAEDKW
jgi:Skp family chaperone for outer membrane proteins